MVSQGAHNLLSRQLLMFLNRLPIAVIVGAGSALSPPMLYNCM